MIDPVADEAPEKVIGDGALWCLAEESDDFLEVVQTEAGYWFVGADFPLEDDFEVGEPVELGDHVEEALHGRAEVDFGEVVSVTLSSYYLEKRFDAIF